MNQLYVYPLTFKFFSHIDNPQNGKKKVFANEAINKGLFSKIQTTHETQYQKRKTIQSKNGWNI